MSVKEFLRTFQHHVYEYGIPHRVISDQGTQLVSGANLIKYYLMDMETQLYFDEYGVLPIKFEQFYKGNKALGSLVESCVKLVKRLISGAIGKTVLPLPQFDLVLAQTVHIVNKRPVALKDILRSNLAETDEDVSPITPELLLEGYELPCLNFIPGNLDNEWKPSKDPVDDIKSNFSKLTRIREKLSEIYQKEFISTLIVQATNDQYSYKPVTHKHLKVGDIVLLVEENTKRTNYPLALVKSRVTNESEEVTDAI